MQCKTGESANPRRSASLLAGRALKAGEGGPYEVLQVLAEHPVVIYPRDDILAAILARPQARRGLRQLSQGRC